MACRIKLGHKGIGTTKGDVVAMNNHVMVVGWMWGGLSGIHGDLDPK